MSDFKDVFISYGRRESKTFATKLHDQLVEAGLSVWFDQNDIPLAVDFQNQIDDGISKAHNFVFIIAPHSLKSPYCLKEIELAIKLNKRIIPILHIEPTTKEIWDQMHPTIAKINWIYMREQYEENAPQHLFAEIDDFGIAFQNLLNLLVKHKDYVELHTQLLIQALAWERNQRKNKYFLVGKERIEAEKWLLTKFKNEQPPCLPTDLHCHFICEAKKNAENMMTDAFISCAAEDKKIRNEVITALARHAITTWNEDSDLGSGQDQNAIFDAIDKADNFLFFISEESIVSISCLKQLKYALKHNKRTIPLMISQLDDYKIPRKIRSLQRIDFTDNVIQENFDEDIDDLLNELNKESDYYHAHKVILTQALKWEKQDKNESILLRGYNLQQAQDWFRIAKTHSKHPPLPIHEEFIHESVSQIGHIATEVFISYSRTDGDFARKINEELQVHGKNTWFDQESISPSANFKEELFKGIAEADNFLFVISPEAINSPYCQEEVAYAASLNKRMITVLYRDVEMQDLPQELINVQWIDFNQKEADFHTAFSLLIRALDLDREHVRGHTRWLQEAAEWTTHDRSDDFLLRGSEFAMAQAWLKEAKALDKKPAPTPLQLEFLTRSQEAIERAAEKERLQEERLLKLEQERVKAANAMVKRQKRTIVIVTVLLLINLAVSGVAVTFYFQAKAAKDAAEEKQLVVLHKQEETNKAKLDLEKALKQAKADREKAIEETEIATEALKTAGLAATAQLNAERRKQQAINQNRATQREFKEFKAREIDHINSLMFENHKAKAEISRLIKTLQDLGVIRPAVKKRLDELITDEFAQLDKALEEKRQEVEKQSN